MTDSPIRYCSQVPDFKRSLHLLIQSKVSSLESFSGQGTGKILKKREVFTGMKTTVFNPA